MLQKFLVVFLCVLLTTALYAGGFSLYEFGARTSAMAGAAVAQAVDASTIFYNPSGLAFLKGTQFYGNLTLIMPNAKYTGPEPYPFAGQTWTAEKQTFTPIGLYIAHKFGDRIGVGIGVTNPFGLGLKWSEDFPGRFVAKNSDLRSFYISPVVAFKITPNFSIGGGLDIVYSSVMLERNILLSLDPPRTDPGIEVGTVHLEGNSNVALGFTASILARGKKVAFGLSYRHKVVNKYENATADFTIFQDYYTNLVKNANILVDQKGKTEIPFPGILTMGLYFRPTEKLGVEFDYQYYTWAVYDELFLDFQDWRLDTRIEENYSNSTILRFGAHYELSDNLSLRAGYLHDNTPQPTHSVSPMLPDNDRDEFTVGFGYRLGNIQVDAGYQYVNSGERSTIENGIGVADFNGTYTSNANLFFVSVGYTIQ